MPLDLACCRRQFPALSQEIAGEAVAFFDGPGGTQVPQSVIDAVAECLRDANANLHGGFATSQRADAVTAAAQQAAADFFGTTQPGTIHFGQNMTSLTFALSRAIAREWGPDDEIVVTHLDHDANVTPWVLAAEDRGARVRKIRFDLDSGRLDLDELTATLNTNTRLVAVGAASNALGTISPIADIVERCHAVGAEVFVDAVHYSSHAIPDVTGWDCDYCACSPYKFFGPHLGMLYGKPTALDRLRPYKVRPAPDTRPECWMTGTQSVEALAGFVAAVDYLASVGGDSSSGSRRDRLLTSGEAIAAHERKLCKQMASGLAAISGIRLLGLNNAVGPPADRVPTFSFTLDQRRPREIATRLGEQGIYVWDGNFYALGVSEAYNLEPEAMHGSRRRGSLQHTRRSRSLDCRRRRTQPAKLTSRRRVDPRSQNRSCSELDRQPAWQLFRRESDEMSERFIQGTVIVVTGGGTGMGKAAAHQLAELGATVVLCGRREAVLRTAVESAPEGSSVKPPRPRCRRPERGRQHACRDPQDRRTDRRACQFRRRQHTLSLHARDGPGRLGSHPHDQCHRRLQHDARGASRHA